MNFIHKVIPRKSLVSRAAHVEDVSSSRPKTISRALCPKASIEGLPFELKIIILRELKDFPSLYNITHVSQAYRKVFETASHEILRRVLLKDVHPALLRDLLLLAKIVRGDYNQGSHFLNFVEIYQKNDVHKCEEFSQLASILESSDSASLERFFGIQVAVHHTTTQFAEFILSHNTSNGQAMPASRPFSPNETLRIHRALYRFELCCILFKFSALSRQKY